MKIKSERSLIPILVIIYLFMNYILIDIFFLQDTYSGTPFGTKCIWMLCVTLPLFLLILGISVVLGRTLEMNEQGCIISLGRIKKFYAWDQFATKRVETYKSSKLFPAFYKRCVFFSTRFYAAKNGTFSENCMFLHPWTCLIIHFHQDSNQGKGMGLKYFFKVYEVDMQEFKKRMQEWSIEVEGLEGF